MINDIGHRGTGARNLRDQSRRVLRDVKELGTIAADNVGDGTERLKERGKEMLGRGREAAVRYQVEARKYVASNPFKTLLIAMGLGTLLGLALRRRS